MFVLCDGLSCVWAVNVSGVSGDVLTNRFLLKIPDLVQTTKRMGGPKPILAQKLVLAGPGGYECRLWWNSKKFSIIVIQKYFEKKL